MGESVEQAALAAAERDALPAPWGSMLSALEALDRLGDSRYYALRDVFRTQADKIETLENENGELRDGMLALSNRIENLTRWHHDLRAEVQAEGDSWREAVAKGAA